MDSDGGECIWYNFVLFNNVFFFLWDPTSYNFGSDVNIREYSVLTQPALSSNNPACKLFFSNQQEQLFSGRTWNVHSLTYFGELIHVALILHLFLHPETFYLVCCYWWINIGEQILVNKYFEFKCLGFVTIPFQDIHQTCIIKFLLIVGICNGSKITT